MSSWMAKLRCLGQSVEFTVARSRLAGTYAGWVEVRDSLLGAASTIPDSEKGLRSTCVELAAYAEVKLREFLATAESRRWCLGRLDPRANR